MHPSPLLVLAQSDTTTTTTLPLAQDSFWLIAPIVGFLLAVALGVGVDRVSRLIGLAYPLLWGLVTAVFFPLTIAWVFVVARQVRGIAIPHDRLPSPQLTA